MMYPQPVQPVTAPSQLADIVVQLDGPGAELAPRLSSASLASAPVDSTRDSSADADDDDDDDATAAPSTPEPKILSAKAQGKQPIAHEAEPRASSEEEPRLAQHKWLTASEPQAETSMGVAGVGVTGKPSTPDSANKQGQSGYVGMLKIKHESRSDLLAPVHRI